MLSKCSNPSCSAVFRTLNDGSLFLLEDDPRAGSSPSNRGEYFWLCHECSSKKTLRLDHCGKVIAVPLPAMIHEKPKGEAGVSLDRKCGQVLCRVSSAGLKPGRFRTRSGRRGGARYAA